MKVVIVTPFITIVSYAHTVGLGYTTKHRLKILAGHKKTGPSGTGFGITIKKVTKQGVWVVVEWAYRK